MYAPAMIRLWRALRNAPTTPAFVFVAFALAWAITYLVIVGAAAVIRGSGA